MLRQEILAQIAQWPYWDAAAQQQYQLRGVPPAGLLQNPQELADLCLWIAENQIRSLLEIGIWTGHLICFLDQLFHFDRLAVCDARMAETEANYPIRVPDRTRCFWGSSHSIEYLAWRQELGPIDLVLIDAEHSYEAVRQDFLINARYPQRFLAFHDIAGDNPWTAGSRRLWQELRGGSRQEIIYPPVAAGIPWMGWGIWSAQP